MRRFSYKSGVGVVREWVTKRAGHVGPKLSWFIANGYSPHLYQLAFHTLVNDATGRLLGFRMLVAGRRGGKTMSAAWEVVYYCLNPTNFHFDVHRTECDDPLHVWVLVPNFKSSGRAAMRTIQKVLRDVGLKPGTDYRWNKGENYIEFANGSFLEFKTAEQADQLIGAGIDILWMDEAAAITDQEAYDYASPALDDKLGIVICTSTPRGKNWWYDLFWSPDAHADEQIGTVEYRSCDNPYYPRERWLYRKKTYHPLLFKQEYMAAFDSMAGKALAGEWLKYYSVHDLPLKNPEGGATRDGRLNLSNIDLEFYIGIDPAISLQGDRFAAVVIGVPKDLHRVYVMDVVATRIPFPEQVDLIQQLFLQWRPNYIGIDSQAYQAALAQMAQRIAGMPPIVPVISTGRKKADRIMSMSPVFRIGKVVIQETHRDFIDEWLDYDPELKRPKDDCLDAAEIALSAAGILLPGLPEIPDEKPAGSMDELAERLRRGLEASLEAKRSVGFDSEIGEW